jgi:hypothetical protein
LSTLDKVGLSVWPFETVPPTSATSAWYGRPQIKSDFERITGSWEFRSTSSIHLLWADFGAGKTHAMRYVQGICAAYSSPVVAVYAELPTDAVDFLRVYQQIVRQIPETVLRKSIYALREKEGSKWLDASSLNGDRDTPRVLWQLAELPDDESGEVARKWLSGATVGAAELRKIGGVAPIKTSNDALRVLSSLQHLITNYGGYSRFVLLLDEFQRVGQASKAKRRDVNAGLHKFFNSCPNNLSIILSYSIGDANAITNLVTPELMSRIEEEMSLPMLSLEESKTFAIEVIEKSSSSGKWTDCIEAGAVDVLVAKLHADSGGRMTPRRLMQVFGTVFERVVASSKKKLIPIGVDDAENYYRPPTADTHS